MADEHEPPEPTDRAPEPPAPPGDKPPPDDAPGLGDALAIGIGCFVFVLFFAAIVIVGALRG